MIKNILSFLADISIIVLSSIVILFIAILVQYPDRYSSLYHVLSDTKMMSDLISALLSMFIFVILVGTIIYIKNIIHTTYGKEKLFNDARSLILNSNIAIKYRDNMDAINNLKIVSLLSITAAGMASNDYRDRVYLNMMLIFSRKSLVKVLAHEMVHLLQYDYYFDMNAMYAYFIKKSGYWNNPLEVEARSVQPISEKNRVKLSKQLGQAQDRIYSIRYRNY